MGSQLSTQTWMYHGGVYYDKDINSGLMGAIIVVDDQFVTSDSAAEDARPCDVDHDVVLLIGSFDESRSW